MRFRLMLAGVLLALAAACAHAEVLHGVEPLDTLGTIKKKYPNAKLTRIKAAWVTEDEDFFRLEGQGFPGTLYIAFSDGRPGWRRQSAEQQQNQVAQGASAPTAQSFTEFLASESDDDALIVNWLRWVPDVPIPMERYKSKYGEPGKCDFKADSMQPYCEWAIRGLIVALSDDKKLVLSAEATYTKAEMRAAWRRRGTFMPDWLKEEPSPEPAPKKQDIKKAIQPKT